MTQFGASQGLSDTFQTSYMHFVCGPWILGVRPDAARKPTNIDAQRILAIMDRHGDEVMKLLSKRYTAKEVFKQTRGCGSSGMNWMSLSKGTCWRGL